MFVRKSLIIALAFISAGTAARGGDAEMRVNQYIIEIYKKQEIEREKVRLEKLRLPQTVEVPVPLKTFGPSSNSYGVHDPESDRRINRDWEAHDPMGRNSNLHLNDMIESEVQQKRGVSSETIESEKQLIQIVRENARRSGYEVVFDPQNPTRVIKLKRIRP